MPRVCNREGCGRRIVGKDGKPRYDRNFCGADCRREDKRERVAELRRKARIGRCGLCGRKAAKDAPQNSAVPRHNAPSVDFGSALDVNGSGAAPVQKWQGLALAAGDIQGAVARAN